MSSLKDAVTLMNVKAEVDSMKRREIALIYALREMEVERINILSALYDANRCKDCIRLHDCEKKRGETTFKAKQRTPEAFCTMWSYGGDYTPFKELLSIARNAQDGRSEGG